MNIKKTFLPLALAAATTLGASTLIKPADINEKPTTTADAAKPTVDEKQIFDYMKYNSNPIKDNKRDLAVIGTFGLGLVGARRRKEIANLTEEINDVIQKAPQFGNGAVNEVVVQLVGLLRTFVNGAEFIYRDKAELIQCTTDISDTLSILANIDSDWNIIRQKFIRINEILDEDYTVSNELYKKQCLKQFDDFKNNIYNFPIAPAINKNEMLQAIESLRVLVEEGESDYPEKLKNSILYVLDDLKNTLDNYSNTDTRELVKEMYKQVPKLTYELERYTSTKKDWESGKISTKERFPQVGYDDYTEAYKRFVSDTLHQCRLLKSSVEISEVRAIESLVRMIKSSMMNHGTWDSRAFAKAMELCDNILQYHISDGEVYNPRTLDYKVKVLLENVYASINNPKYHRPNTTVPKTFEEWEWAMARIERQDKPDDYKPQINQFKKRKFEFGDKFKVYQEEKQENKVNKSNGDGKITFSSVGGQDKAIDLLKKKVLYPIRYPKAFKNRMISHGIIMYGRPGTGKTLMALALSNESNTNFVKINAAQLTSGIHGETDKNWRELFTKAREQQPCIIFIDEFDTVAQKRGHNATNNYDDTVLNTIFTEMSDVEKNGDNIFVIGATNRFEVLDAGVLRAGRFGTHIELKAPETVEDVLQIFDIHTKDKILAEDVDKNKLAKMMLNKNVTGSDIASIVNEALENTFLRLGIYEKMEDGTFNDNDLSYITTTMQDFEDAIANYEVINDKSHEKRAKIGFNPK